MWHGEVLEAAEIESRIRTRMMDELSRVMAEINDGATYYDVTDGTQAVLALRCRMDFNWLRILEGADTPKEPL